MNKFGKKESVNINNYNVENEMDNFHLQMSPSAIPDLDNMLLTIQEMLDFIESPVMKKIEESFLDDFDLANSLEDSLGGLDCENPSDEQKMLETKRKITKLRKIAKKKKEEFGTRIYSKYNSILPMKIISLMIEQERDDNLNELLDLFDRLKQVKSGRLDINDAADSFGEKLRNKYVYPKFDGKENFEKMMENAKEKDEKQKK